MRRRGFRKFIKSAEEFWKEEVDPFLEDLTASEEEKDTGKNCRQEPDSSSKEKFRKFIKNTNSNAEEFWQEEVKPKAKKVEKFWNKEVEPQLKKLWEDFIDSEEKTPPKDTKSSIKEALDKIKQEFGTEAPFQNGAEGDVNNLSGNIIDPDEQS